MSKGALWGTIIAIIIILIILYFAFGQKPAEAPTTDATATSSAPASPADAPAQPTSMDSSSTPSAAPVVAGKTWTLPDGLVITDVAVGNGPIEAKPHDVVFAHYTGTLQDGTKFDSSYDHPGKQPLQFAVGEGRVIKGWDEGLLGMRKGGKRHLVIPAAIAYGAASPSPLIPPNSTLVFDVELTDVWQALVNQPKK